MQTEAQLPPCGSLQDCNHNSRCDGNLNVDLLNTSQSKHMHNCMHVRKNWSIIWGIKMLMRQDELNWFYSYLRNDNSCNKCSKQQVEFDFYSLVKGRLEAARSDEKSGQGTVCQFTILISLCFSPF